MKDLFKYIQTDTIIKWCILLTAVLIVINSIGIGIMFSALPPFVPLYNQLPWGSSRLGTKFELFLPLIIVFLLALGNLFLINLFYEKSPLIARILAVTTFMLGLLTTIFIFQTIQLIR